LPRAQAVSTPRIIVLGAGPAGLSAGLWLRNLGLEAVLLEPRDQAGGMQNLNFLDNNWILGQHGITGQELGQRFREHAVQTGMAIHLGAHAIGLSHTPTGSFILELAEGHHLACEALVITTGTRFRGLEILSEALGGTVPVPGQTACGPYAFQDVEAQAGRHVVIVGGGDNAYENARLLLDAGARVTLVIRSQAKAQQQMLAAVANQPDCDIRLATEVVSIVPRPIDLAFGLRSPRGYEELTAERLHILAGYEPNTGFLTELLPPAWHQLLRLDKAGYLEVDSWGRTGIPGIYAAGDVCNPEFPSVVSALAQGAKVAKAIERDLQASTTKSPLFSSK